ncbi:class II fructose-bisphosphate aldolase [Vibrio sinensis]|uniref:Class II fructose-bisphosphate aldolase n=1 Tax=Vibrio sinensis TaxID=2302434 RepID=A0A3A6QB32_9VIBR|nr:class II fructose-bisphosphate aldolase [Vibrio sinensis]RJX69374.1 class II fructose-bisphosphate aldolase [Vibrio sinensis]
MLVTTKQMLTKAHKGGFAVPSANFIDYDTAKTYVSLAERINKPLILSFAEAHQEYLALKEAAYIAHYLANEANVDVALHLDHGTQPDVVMEAIRLGFTSVMIDASVESLDRNIQITQKIVSHAHKHGVPVEAEIGHVGAGENFESHLQHDSIYTDVNEAIRFAAETNVDFLAVSIGTAHGVYAGVPQLNFERLKELHSAIDIPLVLHGGSSTGDENLARCVANGIAKINIFTDFVTAGVNAINGHQFADYFAAKRAIQASIAEVLEHYYTVFGTADHE